jgi:hypothetical protein
VPLSQAVRIPGWTQAGDYQQADSADGGAADGGARVTFHAPDRQNAQVLAAFDTVLDGRTST